MESISEKKLLSKYSIILVLVVIMVICSVANSNFLTKNNLLNVFRQQSVTIILDFGEIALSSAAIWTCPVTA